MEFILNGKTIYFDEEDKNIVFKHSWYLQRCGGTKYYVAHGGSKNRIWLHREIIKPQDNQIVDHINGNPLDNRRLNLRACNTKQNNRNSTIHKDNKSGFKGVHYMKDRNKWASQIRVDGKKINLGFYKDKIEAAKAYNDASITYFGAFAKLNIV